MQSEIQSGPILLGYYDPLSAPHLCNGRQRQYSATTITSEADSQIASQLNALRSRSISESSEDFIVFANGEDCADGEEESNDEDYNDYDDDEESSEADSEEESDDDDEDFERSMKSLVADKHDQTKNEVRSKIARNRSDGEEDDSRKKVKFNLKPIVHPMIQWDFAYRSARKGPWEMYARDRTRFQSRIQNTERTIGPILDSQHRSHIWQQRFQCKVDIPEDTEPNH